MARPRTLIPLLVGLVLLAACSAFAQQEGLFDASNVKGHPNLAATSSGEIVPWDGPIMPDFEKAAAKYDVPLPLLLALGYMGSHFENRGDAPTIEGGYGVMALRDNNFWRADSLGEAAALTKSSRDKVKIHPGSNIRAAAAVLSDYADQMKIDRSKGLEAWLEPVIRYAGLDPEYSRMFAMEIFEHLAKGIDYVNWSGEHFQFDPQDIGKVDLAKLEPSSARRVQDFAPLNARPWQAQSAGDVFSPMTAQYPPAVWYGAASCNYTATSSSKNTVVIHTIEGSAAGCLSWMNNCSAEVSSHYVTSEAGGVWQMVDEWYKAWHAGCANSYSVGIENEGYAGSASHPQSLYDSVGLLVRDICDSWGIPKVHNTCPPGVLGHVDINNCVCGGTHWDPGGGWNWSYFMSVVNGTTWINPPYLFGSGNDGWSAGNSSSGIAYTGPDNWNGSIYFDQTGNDCFIYTPATNFTGVWGPQVVNVDFYAQNGNTAAHDLQLFWKTNAENSFTAEKSTPVVNYNAQNSWATVNLYINNNKWWGQTVNQMRLDFDNTNHGNRWIINHVVLQNALWWHFDNAGDVMGWTAGNAMSTPWETNSGWPGIMVSDQTGNDGFLYSPLLGGSGLPYNYLGGVNDWIHIRVYPQNGSTTAHDMAIYWIKDGDGTWNEAKSTHVTFNAKDQWADVYVPVGTNPAWVAGHMTLLRLDFDQTNHGNRWIVDYVKTEHFGADTSLPTVPGGLTATAASQTVVNLAWTASSDNTGVNGYKIFRNGTQIATSIAPSYSDTTCAAGTTYAYTVSAYDAVANNSPQSAAANVTTPAGDTQAPTVPTNLAATAASSTRINLTWTASTDNVGVTGYKIYRGGTQIGTSATASYSDTTCASYTTYTYTVSAYDAASNNSAQSTSASATTWDATAPSVPTNLAGNAISPTQVNLTWTASTDNVGVTGYKIYRGGTQIGTSATASYSDTTCVSGITYSYQVSAYDARSNESAKCTAVNVTTPDIAAPSTPTGLAATAISQTQINLTWTASTDNVGVTGYKIFREGVQIGTSATAGYSDTTCDSYTTYTYTVSAYDAAGNNSGLSNSAQATTQPFTDIVVDNPAATYDGSWFTGTSAPDKYGADYAYCTTAATQTKTATFTPKIDIAGYYTVYVWYPQGANRSTMAPFTVVWDGGEQTVNVNQTTGGGQWVTLVTNKKFAAGTAGYVELGNGTGEASLNVMADAVRVLLVSSDLTAPTVPTNLAATAASATSVSLTWTASTDNVAVTGYRIFRNGVAVGTSAAASYTDTGLTQLTTYTYTVAAYDAMGNESAQSASANATTWDGTAPSVPAGLTATAVTPTRVNLSWSASTDNIGVTGYKIYRGGAYVASSATTSYTDTGRSAGTAYSYQVTAYDARGNESAKCTAVNATTPAFSEIILDNGAAALVGAWSTASASTDKYGADYLYASTAVTGTKTATWTPTIAYAGNYNVYVWYPIGSNRATNSPFATYWDGGSATVNVNQTISGGQWVLLQSNRHFLTGTAGYVQLGNGTGATGKIVVADAVRFLQVTGD